MMHFMRTRSRTCRGGAAHISKLALDTITGSRFQQRLWTVPLMQAIGYSTAHAAWHLGAIRQLLGERVVRQG